MSKIVLNTFTPAQYVSDKTISLKTHIENQMLSFKPKLVIEVNDLNSLVTLALAVETKKAYPDFIHDIIAVRFNTEDKLNVGDFCKSLPVTYQVLDISKQVDIEAELMSGTVRSQSVVGKLKRDMSRSILYYISNSIKGMVLTSINKSDMLLGNYSKTSDKVGDWNLIGNATNVQVRELSRYFAVPSEFIDAQEAIDYDYEQKVKVTYKLINSLEVSINQEDIAERRRCDVLLDKNSHKKRFPYNIVADLRSTTPKENVIMYDTNYPLSEELKQFLETLRSKKRFGVDEFISERTMQFYEYLKKFGLINSAVVVLVSGGVDSAAILALAKETKKRFKLTNLKIVAVAVPISSTQEVQSRAFHNCESLGIKCYKVDLTTIHDQLCNKVSQALGFARSQYSDGCFKSSLRAPVAYYVARMYSGIVLGTGNKSEDCYLGYFSKSGDGLVDVQLIADIYKSDVYEVARKLGTIESILTALPTADLFAGSETNTDEDELGFSYDFVELYIRLTEQKSEEQTKLISSLSDECRTNFDQLEVKIVGVHNINKHKFAMPLQI
jgi:NAD+ synthase (glutamine-hydrolysing)